MQTIVLLIALIWAAASPAVHAVVKPGAKVLQERGYDLLANRRVGLITNHTAVIDGHHVAEMMQKSGVRLTAIFTPEHGLSGTAEDGVSIPQSTEGPTAIPVFSLYGSTRKPTPAMLQNIDVLVFDIQDIGARFYTYISTLGLAMQAAAEARIPFIILDRPNPIGGTYVSGFVLDSHYRSFEGMYPIPIAHGMTVGELALMIKGERMLSGLENLDLQVVKMEGWRRDMKWPDTGLPWIRTSPNIPSFENALSYAGTCFFEATNANEGRGTQEPFKVIGFPGVDAAALSAQLNRTGLPGVKFEPVTYCPKSIPGMSSHPKFSNQIVEGVRLVITDPKAYLPVETGMFLLTAFFKAANVSGKPFFRHDGFARLAGTDMLQWAIQEKAAADDIISIWGKELENFSAVRDKYLLYQ